MSQPAPPPMQPVRPTVAQVSPDAITANVRRLLSLGDAQLCAVVKADGYGHGAVLAARAALAGGATWLAVALVEEGEALRAAGITAPILLLAEPPPTACARLLAADLTPMAWSHAMLDALAAVGRERGRPVEVHLKADTGMSRVGIPGDDWAATLDHAASLVGSMVAGGSPEHGLAITGLATHLARADELGADGRATTQRQLDAFDEFLALARSRGIDPPLKHAANSAGLLVHPRSRHTMTRAGIAIYGLSASTEVTAGGHGLTPALSWRTRVSWAKRVEEGTEVSYGHRWKAPATGWLATIPVGYADGLPRRSGGRMQVLVGGRRRPLVGSVCMDQTLVWCAEQPVTVGEEVVLIGRQGGEVVSADDWAAVNETITYEVTCGISARVPRLPVHGEV